MVKEPSTGSSEEPFSDEEDDAGVFILWFLLTNG